MAPLRFVYQTSAARHACRAAVGADKLNRLCARAAYRGERSSASRGCPTRQAGQKNPRRIRFAEILRVVAPLPSDVRGRGAPHRTVSGAASALLAGPSGVWRTPLRRGGFFSPYGWYGYYSYPAPVPSRRPQRRAGAGGKGPRRTKKWASARCRRARAADRRLDRSPAGDAVQQRRAVAGPASDRRASDIRPDGAPSASSRRTRYHRSDLVQQCADAVWRSASPGSPGWRCTKACCRAIRPPTAASACPRTSRRSCGLRTSLSGARVIVARGELARLRLRAPEAVRAQAQSRRARGRGECDDRRIQSRTQSRLPRRHHAGCARGRNGGCGGVPGLTGPRPATVAAPRARRHRRNR